MSYVSILRQKGSPKALQGPLMSPRPLQNPSEPSMTPSLIND